MQAYEHILATMIGLSKDTKQQQGLSLENNLRFMRMFGAYFTYPDSIRALIKLSVDKPFRQPSHMTDGAWMQFIFGDELRNATNGYPLDKFFIPEGSELKAADDETLLKIAREHNPDLLDSIEGKAIYQHLRQDIHTDALFQGYIATCYIDESSSDLNPGENYSLYGIETKAGLARFEQTGTITTMKEFREMVSLVQQLTTLELFKRLQNSYPDITFAQIQEAIASSYDEHYPEAMMNAKMYVVPPIEEQEKILHALKTGDYTYYDGVKVKLVEMRSFKNITDIDRKVSELIDKTTLLDENELDKTNDERDDD